MIEKVRITNLKAGETFDLGTCSLSEQEIIAYAKEFDPLPFHIDPKAGEASIFRGLIASGPHIFHEVHKKEWLPRFGHSVVCGLGVNNWKFLQPLYPNQLVNTKVTIIEIEPSKRKGMRTVKWYYEFLDKHQNPIQTLEMMILHNILE